MRKAEPGAPPGGTGKPETPSRTALLAFGLLLLTSFGAIVGGMRHTSTTFDEIFMMASGARGFETGRFDMTLDHPPVMQYLYGLPIHLTGPEYPEEVGASWGFHNRFPYARAFFFLSGNDPERLAFAGRMVAAVMAAFLALAVFLFARSRFGAGAALLSGGLVAFLPDVLAHGGVAYNDLPLALVFFLGAWALDSAFREPGWKGGALAGAACALALGVKFSALALAPVGVALLGLEAYARRGDGRWLRRVAGATPAFLLALYLGLVLIYRGDPGLSDFRWGLRWNILHASGGHGVPVLFLGRRSVEGFWYFFPVAFFLKTPAALHLLGILAAVGFVRSAAGAGDAGSPGDDESVGEDGRKPWRRLAASPLRVVAVAGLVFLVFLLRSKLNIGFRHALPVLPFVCLAVGVGVVRLWGDAGRGLRAVVVVLLVGYGASVLSHYPHFIPYLSGYAPSDEAAHTVVVDSNLDWGQGLLALREHMEEEGIERVYLSYFGSALPGAYGIEYEPLPSFFPLPEQPVGEGGRLPDAEARHSAPGDPEWVVISATNLAGTYLDGDPFVGFRRGRPHRVLARSLYVYPVEE